MSEAHAIERKWQEAWTKAGLGKAVRDNTKPKFFMIFAYPGISGFLHVGHMRGFSYTDAICRYKRLRGYNVLFPVGTHASGNQAIAFARKVEQGDPAWKQYLLDNGCTAEKLHTLTDPKKIVDYFNQVYIQEYWKRFGFLCDWDRFTCTIHPDYNAFIHWQFRKLHQSGLLCQKPYFATFCPNCGPVAVDPSETDISKGGTAEKNEYTLLKFRIRRAGGGESFLIAATLRPETIYGQTNLWINPEADYVEAHVDGESWIISGPCAEKLAYQKTDLHVISKVDPRTLIGASALAPGVDREIIILPAVFADPHIGTGIVTSVPSDAPYDWIALHDLQTNESECRRWGLDPSTVAAIKPIPIIKTRGFGPHPGIEICQRMGVTSQLDADKLEAATKEIYKAGFHTGTMTDTCGKFHGMAVTQAKEVIKQDLITNGKADCLHDLSEEVICRCGGRVVIKKIDGQWFITYSDNELTERSKKHAETMTVLPKEYHHNLPSVLDWFSDRACARLGNWLGTTLPFDPSWTIEPISDSTLYPLYYLISGYVNDGTITADQLTEPFFDYVVLGTGKAGEVSKKTRVPEAILDVIRQDIAYWYPLDINLGGKEHQTVHFPVFIMNHVATLAPHQWPKGIFVNWWVTGKGGKISKSKGGAQPIPGAIARFGVDAMRLYYAHIGSPDTDVVWDEDVVINYRAALDRILTLGTDLSHITAGKGGGTHKPLDKWLLSRVHSRITSITQAFETFNLREAATQTYFGLTEDLRWYQRRGGSNPSVLQEALLALAALMTPLTPHTAEELHEMAGGKGLASSGTWPHADASKIQPGLESQEEQLIKLITDVRAVMKLSKLENPSKLTIITAAPWTYSLYTHLKKELAVTRDIGVIMKNIMADETLRAHGKDATKIIGAAVKDPSRLPSIVCKPDEEISLLKDASGLIKDETGLAVTVESGESSKHPKAGAAMPGKPAIVIT